MRQHHPEDSTFLLCLDCDRGEWRRIAHPLDAKPSVMPSCKHCGGATEERWPLTLALTEADRGLLKSIAEWSRVNMETASQLAIHNAFRHAATERAGKGKPLPQWAAEWLQNHSQK